MNFLSKSLFAVLILFGLSYNSTAAAVYYVDKDHSSAANTNDGSESSPWLTIQHGVNQLIAGDTLYVKQSAQPYFEPYRASSNDRGAITIDVSGAQGNPITISGYPGERPVIDQQLAQSYLKAEDGTPDTVNKDLGGFYVRNSDYITIKNFEIRQTSESSIMMNSGGHNTGIIVEDNHLHHVIGGDNLGGVRLDLCDSCIVRNNIIHDTYYTNGATSNPYTSEPYSMHSGVHGFRPGNSVIENNLIYNVAKGVYEKGSDTEGLNSNKVSKNIFYNISDAAHTITVHGGGSPPSFNSEFSDNLVFNGKKGVDFDTNETGSQSINTTIKNNIFHNLEEGIATRGLMGVNVFDNIFHTITVLNYAAEKAGSSFNNINEIDYFDYNSYFNADTTWILDRYGVYNQYRTLAEWQNALSLFPPEITVNPDQNAYTFDPLFTNAANEDFTFQGSSQIYGAGRFGGDLGVDVSTIGPDWNLSDTPPAPEPPSTCTSWTYSDWNDCESDSTQTRTVLTSSPISCTGGAPVLEQSCAYTAPVSSGGGGGNSNNDEDVEDEENEVEDDTDSESVTSEISNNNTTDRGQLLAQIEQLLALIAILTEQKANSETFTYYSFTRAFKHGDEHSDVMLVQQRLNRLGFTVSIEGAGSLGNETTYYGPRTTEAIQRFQCRYNIICTGTPDSTGYGNFGPLTREKLGSV